VPDGEYGKIFWSGNNNNNNNNNNNKHFMGEITFRVTQTVNTEQLQQYIP
jgi:hypothetical protein